MNYGVSHICDINNIIMRDTYLTFKFRCNRIRHTKGDLTPYYHQISQPQRFTQPLAEQKCVSCKFLVCLFVAR